MGNGYHLFSMDIDEVFSIPGRGTVAKGKITTGYIKSNEEVIIKGGINDIKTKVSGIEKSNKLVNEAGEGDEVSLLLGKVNPNDVEFAHYITVEGSEELEELYEHTWQELRGNFRSAKKEKQYEKVINIATKIIVLDTEATFIGIGVPLFEKDIADAYLKLDQKDKAIEHYQTAIAGFKSDHEKYKKTNPDYCLKDIEQIEKKLKKLLT